MMGSTVTAAILLLTANITPLIRYLETSLFPAVRIVVCKKTPRDGIVKQKTAKRCSPTTVLLKIARDNLLYSLYQFVLA